jgi:hypothetical protein
MDRPVASTQTPASAISTLVDLYHQSGMDGSPDTLYDDSVSSGNSGTNEDAVESTNPADRYRSPEGYASFTRTFDATFSAQAALELFQMMRNVGLGTLDNDPVFYFLRDVFGDSARENVKRIRASMELVGGDWQLQPTDSAFNGKRALPDLLERFDVRFNHLAAILESHIASEYHQLIRRNAANAVCEAFEDLVHQNSQGNRELLAQFGCGSPTDTYEDVLLLHMARRLGVSRQQITDTIRGVTWIHMLVKAFGLGIIVLLPSREPRWYVNLWA